MSLQSSPCQTFADITENARRLESSFCIYYYFLKDKRFYTTACVLQTRYILWVLRLATSNVDLLFPPTPRFIKGFIFFFQLSVCPSYFAKWGEISLWFLFFPLYNTGYKLGISVTPQQSVSHILENNALTSSTSKVFFLSIWSARKFQSCLRWCQE